MVKGSVYIGKIHNEPVIYKGLEQFEDTNDYYHQFEYIKHHEKIIGYGQSEAQVRAEQYKLSKGLTILYGRKKV